MLWLVYAFALAHKNLCYSTMGYSKTRAYRMTNLSLTICIRQEPLTHLSQMEFPNPINWASPFPF